MNIQYRSGYAGYAQKSFKTGFAFELAIIVFVVCLSHGLTTLAKADTPIIFIDFGPDSSFPTFEGYPQYPTSPLAEFDAADLYPGWGANETNLLKSKVTDYIEGLFSDFGVVVTQQEPRNGQPFQTIGIDSTRIENSNAIGLATIDNDAFDNDFARVWAGNVAEQNFTRLNEKPNDLEFWANAIGMTAVHEAAHNYGLTHCDGDLTPQEQARGESRSDHIMQAGDFGCFWNADDIDAFLNNSYQNMHFSDTSVRKLNQVFGISERSLAGDCNFDGKLDAADLSCVASILARDTILRALDTRPGDLDGKDGVTFRDFLILADNFGTNASTYSEGNIDLIGGVEFADFLVLAENFGRNPADFVAVPEPSGLHLILTAVAVLALRQREKCVRWRSRNHCRRLRVSLVRFASAGKSSAARKHSQALQFIL